VTFHDRVVEYRQIVTRGVCGKGRKFSKVTHTIQPPSDLNRILGAWVINHNYTSQKVGEAVEVRGSYDINIWYSTKGNTKTDVMKETVHYVDQVPLSYYDRHAREASLEVSAAVVQAPNCVEASIASHNDAIIISVEKELVVELVGETKMCVAVYPLELAETDDKDSIMESYDEAETFEDLDPDLIIDDLED
jgi:spore coat protein E